MSGPSRGRHAAPETPPAWPAAPETPPAWPAEAEYPLLAAPPPPGAPVAGRRRHRLLFRLAVLAAAAVTAAGIVIAVRGNDAEASPADVVRGFFAAVAAGDAPRALAYGDVPAGSHALLTTTVLRVQQRLAPLTDVRVAAVTRRGTRATARVSYRLSFPGAPQDEADTVGLHRDAGRWRLDTVAVATSLHLPAAAQRATLAGARVPDGDQLLFPGAVPITFDTPYLELSPDDGVVTFAAQPTTLVFVQVTAAGRRAVAAAVRTSLDTCFGAQASPRLACPQPTERYVPGTLRGTAQGSIADALTVDVQTDPAGLLEVSGRIPVRGTYRRLSFTNQLETGSGTIVVPVQGSAYAVAPLRIRWSRSA